MSLATISGAPEPKKLRLSLPTQVRIFYAVFSLIHKVTVLTVDSEQDE